MWESYSAADSATIVEWTLTRSTLEGDPISYAISASKKSIEVTQDTSADKFGGPNRGITTWRCSTMTKIARTAGSFTFTFSGCTGTEFPPPSL